MTHRRTFIQQCGLTAAGFGAILPRIARAAAAGAAPDFGPLALFIATHVTAGEVPGAGVIVARHGETLYERYWGTCGTHQRPDEPFDGSVVNCFFSFSKLVSATVIATLCQDGVLDYGAPISKYIPQFTGGGKEKITLRHLLTHSAGIPAVPLKSVAMQPQWDEAVKTVCAAAVAWEPGSRCVYHGITGLFVAAEAARRITGKNWNDLCKERLFDPLGVACTFDMPPQPAKVSLVPVLQPDVLKQVKYGDSYRFLGLLGHPAGSCFGTPADLIKVIQLHLSAGEWNGKTIVQPDVIQQMHTVQYAREIQQAIAAGKAPAHQSWGLGPLLRGTGPADAGHAWFGFGDRPSPGMFGHAGIATVMGVGDPALGVAIAFITTDAPKPESKAVELRNGVTNRIFKMLA